MTGNQTTLVMCLVGLLVGLAAIACGAYLALRRPDRLRSDAFAKRLGVDRTPRSYWAQCVAIGAFFSSASLMALFSDPGAPEHVMEGWEAVWKIGLLGVAVVAIFAVMILQAGDSKEKPDGGDGEA